MNFYDTFMEPLEKNVLGELRKMIIPAASGSVLELGYGTGANFQYYNPASVKSLSALDPRSRPVAKTRAKFPVRFIQGYAEEIPFPDGHFDTVVETLVFCSVRNLNRSIAEVLRVLKPGGAFIFLDHVKPPEKGLSVLFSAMDVFWPKIAGGCHLTREPDRLIRSAGFRIEKSGTEGYGIFHWGIGRKR